MMTIVAEPPGCCVGGCIFANDAFDVGPSWLFYGGSSSSLASLREKLPRAYECSSMMMSTSVCKSEFFGHEIDSFESPLNIGG